MPAFGQVEDPFIDGAEQDDCLARVNRAVVTL
jgi:hypothetical protein